jgi:N-acetyl-anhydromuramyl-L-alanine amidase AmpD
MVARVWIPSPNYNSSRSRNQILCIHTSEGAQDFHSLGNFLANPGNQVSYQCGADNTTATQIGEYVKPPGKAWAAMNANDWGEHICCCTPAGGANWSRDTWLSKDNMLRAVGAWLAEEAARFGIPLVKINADQIRAGVKGVCGHGDVSAAGAGGSHYDPGSGFPFDRALEYAGGGGGPPPGPAAPWPVFPRRGPSVYAPVPTSRRS